MYSGLSTHFEKCRWDAIEIGLTSSSIAQRGWWRATSLLWPSSCLDFLCLCNSWRLHKATKFSQYCCLRSPCIVKRGLETSADVLVAGLEEDNVDSGGGHPREARRARWSAIACGLNTARALSTLWSTAATRCVHWGRVFVTEVKISSVSLSVLIASSRMSCNFSEIYK